MTQLHLQKDNTEMETQINSMEREGPQINGHVKTKHMHKHALPQQPTRLRYEDIQHTTHFLQQRTKHRPTIGVVCGSGLGGLVNVLQNTDAFDYKDIPHFPVSTVSGHVGRLVFGQLHNSTVVCMQGRVHGYEGYPMWQITFPIRVMKALGVDTLIVTNASGGLNKDYSVGDLMIIKDHLNIPGLAGLNPLVGLSDPRFGVRFPALSKAYDISLRQLAWEVAEELGFDFVREGVYCFQSGPAYETVAECRMMQMMGADVTGMSSVPEVMVAKHCDMRVFGMSLVTNSCVMDYDTEEQATHAEVLQTGKQRAEDMQRFFVAFLRQLNGQK